MALAYSNAAVPSSEPSEPTVFQAPTIAMDALSKAADYPGICVFHDRPVNNVAHRYAIKNIDISISII